MTLTHERWRSPWCCLFAFWLAACGESSGLPAWTGTIDTLANGAVRVTNAGEGLWTPESAWSLRETCRIGGAAAEGPEQFSAIVGLTTDASGRLYVLDRRAQEVRVFTRAGAHVRTIGRPGEGPGEFSGANGVTPGPQASIWVIDPGNSRYTALDTAGIVLSEYTRPIASYGYISEARFTAEGDLAERGSRRGPPGADGRPQFIPVVVRMRIDSTLSVRDSLDLPFQGGESFHVTRTEGGRIVGESFMSIPFNTTLATVLDPRGYLWSGDNDEYRIWQQTFDGDSIRAIERAIERLPVSGEERQNAIAGITERAGTTSGIDFGRIPDVKPYYKRFLVDDLGYLWVWRTTASDSASFDIFDPEGRFLGSLDTNARINPYAPIDLRTSSLTVTESDELDVPVIVCFAIDGRSPPAESGG